MNNSIENTMKTLRAKMKVFIVGIFLFTLFGLILTLILPKYYKSQGVFYLVKDSDTRLSSLTNMLLTGTMPANINENIDIENLIETELVREDVLEKTNLMKIKNIKKKSLAYGWLKKNVDINPYRDGMVKIACRDKDPELAKRVAESYMGAIEKFYRESKVFVARNYRIYLEERESELYEQMSNNLKQLQIFQTKEEFVYPEIEYKSIYETLLAPLKQKMLESEYSVAENKAIYGNKDASEKSAKELKLSSEILDNLYSGDSKAANSLSKFPDKIRQYIILKLNADISVELYSAVRSELENAKLQERKDVPSMQVIDYPQVPEEYFFPRKRDGLLVGLLLGTILMSIYIYMLSIKAIKE